MLMCAAQVEKDRALSSTSLPLVFEGVYQHYSFIFHVFYKTEDQWVL